MVTKKYFLTADGSVRTRSSNQPYPPQWEEISVQYAEQIAQQKAEEAAQAHADSVAAFESEREEKLERLAALLNVDAKELASLL